jgi:PAS domain S-box-containing protein
MSQTSQRPLWKSKSTTVVHGPSARQLALQRDCLILKNPCSEFVTEHRLLRIWRFESRKMLLTRRGRGVSRDDCSQYEEERKETERAFRESEEWLRVAAEVGKMAIVASAMDSIISVDEQQRVVLFNAAAEKMFCCSAAEALGQPVERFIPERFRSAHRAHIQRFGETGVTNRDKGSLGTLWAVRADGEEFPIEASISQIESGGNKLFTVILRDITERQRAEEALRKSEERFSKAFRSSPLAVTISTETEGRYLDVNDAFLQMLGYPRREVIGRTAQELNFWEQPLQRLELIGQLKKSGRVTGFHTRRSEEHTSELQSHGT